MEEVNRVLGRDTTIGVSQLLYDIVINSVRKADSVGQPYGYKLDDFEDISEDEEEYGVVMVKNQSMIIKKPLRTLDDKIILKIKWVKDRDMDYYKLTVNIELIGMGEVYEDDEVSGLSSIINYGTEKLKSLVKENILSSLDGLVDDQWLFFIKDVRLSVYLRKEHGINAAILIVSLIFKVIDESEIRPQGKLYTERMRVTKVGK